jgi:hypothetical protein
VQNSVEEKVQLIEENDRRRGQSDLEATGTDE